MTKKETVWDNLKSVNVNEHTESKGKFTYLSWTFAWSELMKVYPNANYEVLPVEYHQDGSATVHTKLTIGDVTHPMYLPVMNHQNKAIPNPNSFDINKARMRCLVKNIAMFGLGIYIYAGEDLPEAEKVDPETVAAINDAANKRGADLAKTCAHFHVKSVSDLNQSDAEAVLNKLEAA